MDLPDTGDGRVRGAHAVETEDGELIALLILPMPVRIFARTIEVLAMEYPNAVVRQAANYTITRRETNE